MIFFGGSVLYMDVYVRYIYYAEGEVELRRISLIRLMSSSSKISLIEGRKYEKPLSAPERLASLYVCAND